MRPVGLVWVTFVYVFSLGAYMTDVLLFIPLGMSFNPIIGDPSNNALVAYTQVNAPGISDLGSSTLVPSVNGTLLDQVVNYSLAGQQAVWTLLSLLSGTYMFGYLSLIGIPSIFLLVIQLIFGLAVAATIIYYVMGRGN